MLRYVYELFQFDIHPVILTVQVDMADKKKLGHAILGAFTGEFEPKGF